MKYSFTRAITGETKNPVPENVDGKMVFFLSTEAVTNINAAFQVVVESYKTAKKDVIKKGSAKALKHLIREERELIAAISEWTTQLKAYKHNPHDSDN